nr:hypothetical protein [Tanacetum cinerariifolium]
MMRIKMKNLSLDQTRGPREEEKEKSQSQKALQRKKRPRPLASLLKGPNLIKRLKQVYTSKGANADNSRFRRALTSRPLPLIPNSQGRRVIPFDHFINNDLEYLRGGASNRKYTTSVTETKAVDYGHINSRKADKSDGRIMLCFKRLSKNVHKKHRHPKACGRPSARCQKLPKEAEPHKSGYVPFRSEAQRGLHRLLQSKRIHLSE